MIQFAANLTMLFNEFPFLDRFEQASKAGFKAVEFLFPYGIPAEDIKAKLDQYHLKLVLHNLPAGNWDGGERGIACLPDRIEEFKTGVAEAIRYAGILGVGQLNCLAGKVPAGADRAELHRTFVNNLRYAAAELKKAQLKLLVEPINPVLNKLLVFWMKLAQITYLFNMTFTMHNAWKVNWPIRLQNI